MALKFISKKIKRVFQANFGETPLRERNDDILREAIELSRFTSIPNLKEEHGDLLCSLLMSFVENGWDSEECIEQTLSKIDRRRKQYHAYSRKMSVAIIGGAFDPLHNGHIAIAEFLLNFSSRFDSVWFMPCFKHMYGKKMASTEDRLQMCRLATKHDRRIMVSDYEIQHKLGGETYHLAKKLLAEKFAKDQYDFSFVIGMDNAKTFDKWKNYRDLENLAKFVVVPRAGVEIKPGWFLNPPHMLLAPEKPLPEISSTCIRSNLRIMYSNSVSSGMAYKFLDKNLDPEVFTYIKKHSLYKECP